MAVLNHMLARETMAMKTSIEKQIEEETSPERKGQLLALIAVVNTFSDLSRQIMSQENQLGLVKARAGRAEKELRKRLKSSKRKVIKAEPWLCSKCQLRALA